MTLCGCAHFWLARLIRSPAAAPATRSSVGPSRHPIRHHQPRHARELAAVGRHQGGAPAAGLSRDETVIGADRRALALQISADVASVRGVFRIEWKDIDAEAKKSFEQTFINSAPVALGEPIAHLE